MKTRLIALSLLAALALGILSGCVNASARQPDAPVNPTETPASDVPATANEPAEAPTLKVTEVPAPPSGQLTKEESIAIALAHAGLSESQVTRLKAEFDYDDGRPEYDVEFKYDGWEYEYEIHAESGKILSYDKERDD